MSLSAMVCPTNQRCCRSYRKQTKHVDFNSEKLLLNASLGIKSYLERNVRVRVVGQVHNGRWLLLAIRCIGGLSKYIILPHASG